MSKEKFINIASLIAICCFIAAMFLITRPQLILQYTEDCELNTEIFYSTKEYNERVVELKKDSTIVIYHPQPW